MKMTGRWKRGTQKEEKSGLEIDGHFLRMFVTLEKIKGRGWYLFITHFFIMC